MRVEGRLELFDSQCLKQALCLLFSQSDFDPNYTSHKHLCVGILKLVC